VLSGVHRVASVCPHNADNPRTDLLVELARLVRGGGTHDRSEWHVLQRLL
jgi:hypothetical protein